MPETNKPQNPKDIEIKKLKGIVRNQINEIKSLKEQMANGLDNEKIVLKEKALLKKHKQNLDDLRDKLTNSIKAKDSIITSLKKDLKSSQREIEGHLKRHSDDLKSLHESLISERTSRDFLLANLTNELITSLRTGADPKPSKKKTDTPAISKEAIGASLKPEIEKVHIPYFEAEEDKHKMTILYAAPQMPNFDESSGGKRAYLMLKLLAEQYNVICYSTRISKQSHRDALESLGIRVINNLEPQHVIEKVDNIDVIIAAWYFSYYEIKPIIQHFSTAKFIVDSVDIHWVREERSIGNWDGISIDKQQENKLHEIEVYSKADIIWVVSEEDRVAVHKALPSADVRIVSNIHIMKPDSYVKEKPNNILFFGGYNHYPNINAIHILAKTIFPKILQQVDDARLIIAGSNAPEDVKELGHLENVDYKGFINFADIKKLYQDSKLTIVPLTEGAGIKGKICEAIEYMTPVVTNDIGNEGIRLVTQVDGFVSNDYDEMAQFAIEILEDKHNLKKLTENAQDKVQALLGPETNMKVMVESFRPTVDICIVTYNKLELLQQCLDSIFKNTKYPHYNIIVYSNGCTDGTQEYLQKLSEENPIVEAILSDSNDVFVKPNNAMMRTNSTHDVVLINNDVQVTENWLSALVKEAYKSKSIGIVGSKILYPDNTLQEFGSELYATGSGMNIGKHGDPNAIEFMKPKKASYVSGCSMYIKRSTILAIGVFDELFDPCYAEDSDYCYTAWEEGIEVNVTPESIVYHLEGASSGTDTNTGFKRFQKINIQKFLSKHGNTVELINKKVHELNLEYPHLRL